MHRRDLEDSRLVIVQAFPFLASMASLIRFKEVKGLNTVGCDKTGQVYYDPDLHWSKEEVNLGLLHEVCHLVNLHFPRWEVMADKLGKKIEKLNGQVLNISGDCEINPPLYELSLIDHRFRFRNGYGVFPGQFGLKAGLTSEQYYEKLMKQVNDTVDAMKKAGLHADCGSAADGQKREWEDEEDGSGPSQEQLEQAAQDAGQEMAEWGAEVKGGVEGKGARQEGSKAGKGHHGFNLSALPRLMTSKLWLDTIRKTLNEYLRLKGSGYARPNRRYRLDPLILPGRQYQPANVAAIVDVSGSINERSAHQAFKLGAQLRGLGIRLRIVACDDHAQEITSTTTAAYGGGGTQLSKGLDLIDRTMPDTDVCIVISDGETYPWGEKRRYPVVLFTWSEGGAEWMKTIRMPVL